MLTPLQVLLSVYGQLTFTAKSKYIKHVTITFFIRGKTKKEMCIQNHITLYRVFHQTGCV